MSEDKQEHRDGAALGTGSYMEQARGWQRKLALEQGCHSVPEAGMSGIPPQTAIFRTCLLTFKIIPVLTHSFPQALPHPSFSSGESMFSPALLTCFHQSLCQRHQCHEHSPHMVPRSASVPIAQDHRDRGPCSVFTSFIGKTTDKVATCHQQPSQLDNQEAVA